MSVVSVLTVPIDRIKPYGKNPRLNDDAVGAVAASISEFGFNSPVVVDKKYVVIAGHTRLKAAQSLGLTEVPVVVVDLPEEKAKEYRIADNKTAEFSDWAMADLISELRELGDMSQFFPMIDVAALLADTAGATNYKTPEKKDIDAEEQRLAGHFKGKAEAAQARYCRVVCPSCGEEFFVDSAEAKTVAKREAERG